MLMADREAPAPALFTTCSTGDEAQTEAMQIFCQGLQEILLILIGCGALDDSDVSNALTRLH